MPGRVRVTKQTAGTMDFQAYLRSYWLIFGGTVHRRAIKYPRSERPFRVSRCLFSLLLPSLFPLLPVVSSRSVSVFNRYCLMRILDACELTTSGIGDIVIFVIPGNCSESSVHPSDGNASANWIEVN